jgi:flagellar biosynthetic protein FlhB
MAQGGDEDDKTEEPTETRLREAREKGDVVYSTEVASALSLLAVTMIAAFMAGPIMNEIGSMLVLLLANADRPMDSGALSDLFATLLVRVGVAIGLASLLLMGAGIVSRIIQDQFVFTGERMKPQLERINPIDGFKRVFGVEAFAQFIKSSAKLVVVGAVIIVVLWPDDATLETLPLLDVTGLWAVISEKAMALLIACVVAVTVIAMADYMYTRFQHRKRLRMSQYDLKQEFKQNEGNPEVRAKLRQIRMQRAARRMMQQVPRASVVITNPTHYAVALRYDKDDAPAPMCLAKGIDDIALKIREIALENGIPIVEDPPLARALYASAELDEVIPREHFEPVAKIIGYVLQLAERRRARGRTR